MKDRSLEEILKIIEKDPRLDKFQKERMIKALTEPDLRWNEDEFLSQFSPDAINFLMESFPYPVPKYLYAFGIDGLLRSKIESLRRRHAHRQLRYHSQILSYFNDLSAQGTKVSIADKYRIVFGHMSKLWVTSDKNPSIFKEARDFEPILRGLPNYRDHFIHSFNVFLLGYYIINRLKELNSDLNLKSNDYNLTWMLASTFHDVGYAIQEIEFWLNELLKKFLGVNPAYSVDISEVMPLIYVDFLRLISHWHAQPLQTASSLGTLGMTDLVFYNEISSKLVEKNHGVLGGLMLAHLLAVREGFAKERKWDFLYNHLPACHAISLHHLSSVPLSFNKHPIAFLLILCDELQDWGRPSNQAADARSRADVLYLEDLNITYSDRPEIHLKVMTSEGRKKEFEEILTNRLRVGQEIKITVENTAKQEPAHDR